MEHRAIRARHAKDCGDCSTRFGRIDVLVNNAGFLIPEALHGIHDRRLQHFSLHDACRLALRFTARGKANVAQKSGEHRQHLNDPG